MNIKIGNQGNDVKEIQKRLSQWGFNLIADGIFGPKTHAAVKEFQKAMGLLVDGIVGRNTYSALYDEIIQVKHFKKEEFKCKCNKYCTGYINKNYEYGNISYALLILLERIRSEVSKRYKKTIPCNISFNGGYRCYRHNRNVGGAGGSMHILGKAADIMFAGVPVSVVNSIAEKINPYGGVGLKGNSITHVDVRGQKARWYY